MTTLWIMVAIFVVVAVVAGAVQIVTMLGDKKFNDDVANDDSRLHTHPCDPENPSSPDDGRS